MKREQATERLCELLSNVDARGRHAQMIDEIWVFGSYARGSLTPSDIDLEVVITPDDRYRHDEVRAFSGYRHPRPDFLREIRGSRRCFEIAIVRRLELDFPEKKLLFRRGDALAESLARLEQIQADPTAGRAPRDPVVAQLEGLDKELTRTERAELSALCAAGWLAIQRLTIADRGVTPAVERALGWVYSERSALRRAARAVIAELEMREVDPSRISVADAHLGRLLVMGTGKHPRDVLEPTHAIGWRRVVEDGVGSLGAGAQEYWHVLKPTKRPPIDALVLRAGERAPAEGLANFAGATFSRTEILPELERWIVRQSAND